MLFRNIQMIDPSFQILDNMTVATKGDTIAFIGGWDDLPSGQNWGEHYEGKGRLLIPGLYNIHGHTPMTLLRGYGENLNLQDWLEQKIFPFEKKETPDDQYFGHLLGIAEMLRFGTVSCSDMYASGDSMARAVLDSGFKSNVCVAVVCLDGSAYEDLPDYQDNQRFFSQYHLGGGGRLKLDLSLHAEYTSTPRVASGLARHCKDLHLNMHVHVSETQYEHEGCKERHHGKTPVRYLSEQGIFDCPATAAHCVWVEDSDLDILAEKGVTIAANPMSNLKLASGIAPIPKAMAKGVNIGLGTDGAASNNNLNLFEELKLHATLHKAAASDPTLITPEEAFACATIHGAHAQGRIDCGSIAVGNKADLVVLDASAPNMQPLHHQLYNLVYAATGGEVLLTMVDGKVLYRDGKWPTIDVPDVVKQANAACQRIRRTLHM